LLLEPTLTLAFAIVLIIIGLFPINMLDTKKVVDKIHYFLIIELNIKSLYGRSVGFGFSFLWE